MLIWANIKHQIYNRFSACREFTVMTAINQAVNAFMSL